MCNYYVRLSAALFAVLLPSFYRLFAVFLPSFCRNYLEGGAKVRILSDMYKYMVRFYRLGNDFFAQTSSFVCIYR